MALIGSINPFDSKIEQFESYKERMQHVFRVNVVEENMKVSMFITLAGPEVYRTLKNLVAPAQPDTLTYDEIIEALSRHYSPAKLEIAERFKFHRCQQKAEQTIADYIVEIKSLASSCNFGTFLDSALRDRLVCGLLSETIQKRLLSEVDLTLEKACKIAQSFELAERQVKLLQPGGHISAIQSQGKHYPKYAKAKGQQGQASMKPKDWGRSQMKSQTEAAAIKGREAKNSNQSRQSCYRCGRQHSPQGCPAVNWKCYVCNRMGHTSKMCRNKGVGSLEEQSNKIEASAEAEPYPFLINYLANKEVPCKLPFYIDNQLVEFELDTGACKTCISVSDYKKYFSKHALKPICYKLNVITGQNVEILGEIVVKVSRNKSTVELPVAVISSGREFAPLLGRNWMNVLWPRWHKEFSAENCTINQVVQCNSHKLIDSIKTEFKSVFVCSPPSAIKDIEVSLRLKEGAKPVFRKAYSMPYALKPKVEAKLATMVKEGILKPVSHSEWASPLVIIPKKDGDVRICVDFRATVNQAIVTDQYPLPVPEDIFASLAGGKVFTVLDLSGAYQQLKVREESQELLTISTHVGLLRYTRLPFGITSAPAIFQNTMDRVLMGIPHVSCYLDDILISGTSLEHCREVVRKVFLRLEKYNIKVNESKCRFFEQSVEYLGHRIDEEGIYPTKEKIRAITEAPEPENVSQLRSFLGLLNYYSKFVPMISAKLQPLYRLLEKGVAFNWNEECRKTFQLSKDLLVQNQILVHFDPSKPIVVSCDSSSYGIGCVLSHRVDGVEKPIQVASATLSPAERNYSQIEREALAIVFGVKRFHKFIYGRKFTLVSDHQPLKLILGPEKGIPTMAASRIVRWNVILSAYCYDIEYRKGSELYEADALSRLPLSNPTTIDGSIHSFSMSQEVPLSSDEVAKYTKRDSVLVKVFGYCQNGWPDRVDSGLKPYSSRRNELSIEDGCLLWGNRVIIPEVLRSSVLELIHEQHIGIMRSKMLARSIFWWPKLQEDIEVLIQRCRTCQLNQNASKEQDLTAWPESRNVWQRIHADFFYKNGYTFLLIIDSRSRWLDVHLMSAGIKVSQTIEKFKETFAIMGLPFELVTDNGPPFNSSEFVKFCQVNGIKCTKTPPYHPQSNGLAERYVQTVKRAFEKHFLGKHSQVTSMRELLTDFLFSYRNTPNSVTGLSPNEVVFKMKPRTRLSMLKPGSSPKLTVKDPDGSKNFIKPKLYAVGEKVFVRNLGVNAVEKWKEGVVVKVLGTVTYLVKVADKILHVHANSLRKSYLLEESENVPDIVVSNPELSLPGVINSPALPVVREVARRSEEVAPPNLCGEAAPCLGNQAEPSVTCPSPSIPDQTPELRRSTRNIRRPQRLDL